MTHGQLQFDFGAMPQYLKNSERWCLAKFVPDPQKPGQVYKRPHSVKTGKLMDVQKDVDLKLLVPFEEAKAAYLAGGWDAIGYCVSHSAFTAFDLDKCFKEDGSLKTWAQQLVEAAQSYVEYSPSHATKPIAQQGLHIWARRDPGAWFSPKSKDIVNFSDGSKLEAFNYGYLTVTGWPYEVTP